MTPATERHWTRLSKEAKEALRQLGQDTGQSMAHHIRCFTVEKLKELGYLTNETEE